MELGIVISDRTYIVYEVDRTLEEELDQIYDFIGMKCMDK